MRESGISSISYSKKGRLRFMEENPDWCLDEVSSSWAWRLSRPWKGSARSKNLPFFSARSKNLLTLLQGHKILQGHKVKEKTSARSEKNWPKIARSFYFDSKIARSPDCEFAGRSQGHEKKRSRSGKSARSNFFAKYYARSFFPLSYQFFLHPKKCVRSHFVAKNVRWN